MAGAVRRSPDRHSRHTKRIRGGRWHSVGVDRLLRGAGGRRMIGNLAILVGQGVIRSRQRTGTEIVNRSSSWRKRSWSQAGWDRRR